MRYNYLTCGILAAALSLNAAHAASTPVTLNGGGSSLAAPTFIAEFKAYSAAKSKVLFSYAAVGSGGGQNGFLNNNINYFLPYNASTNTVGYQPGTLTYGTIVGTQVDFGASDAPLASSQLTNAATGSYGTASEGSAVDGPLVQIPTFGVPITFAYNQSALPNDALTLNDAQICGVLSGKISDWNTLDAAIPAGTIINVVYFSNSSGTTYLTTQHLNAVCNSANSNFVSYPVPITKTFSSDFAGGTVPPNFTGESASANVAIKLQATANSIAYLSPDYTSIAPNSPNTTSLQVASVTNGINSASYLPNVANTTLGLTNPGPGSSNPLPPATLSAAQNPLNWVPAIPQTTKGYPIVGYSTLELSSCYANKTAGKDLITFLKDQIQKSGPYETIITNNGFVPLLKSGAASFGKAVSNTFLSNKSGYDLDIDDASACASYAGR
jgi:ABC-type phosphate transport system substrate-binding protein